MRTIGEIAKDAFEATIATTYTSESSFYTSFATGVINIYNQELAKDQAPKNVINTFCERRILDMQQKDKIKELKAKIETLEALIVTLRPKNNLVEP